MMHAATDTGAGSADADAVADAAAATAAVSILMIDIGQFVSFDLTSTVSKQTNKQTDIISLLSLSFLCT